MRIGVDIRPLMDKRYSGISEFTLNLIEALLKLDSENEYKLFYNAAKDLGGRMPDFNQPNVKVIKTGFPNKLFNYLMQKILKRPKLDELLAVDLFFSPHLNFTALSSKAKKALVIHDLSFELYPEYFSARKNFWHNLLSVGKQLRSYDKIIAISESTKNDLMRLFSVPAEKIQVIYSGLGSEFRVIDRADPLLQQTKKKYGLPDKFILCLSTIEPRKNIQGVIKAYESALKSERIPDDYQLVIAGGIGWKSEGILKAWRDSEFKNKIKFLGYVDREDKVCIYNLASIFIYVSFYEGFGFPPLEAMACGVPVIASSNSSLAEVVQDAGLLVNPYDLNEVASGLGVLLNNQEAYDIFRHRGLEQASNFTWQKAAQSYLDLFGRLKK